MGRGESPRHEREPTLKNDFFLLAAQIKNLFFKTRTTNVPSISVLIKIMIFGANTMNLQRHDKKRVSNFQSEQVVKMDFKMT